MTDIPVNASRNPIYLADLFFVFRVYAEQVFSAESKLRRIEEAERPTSKKVLWTPEENRAKHRRAYERQQLRNGLALYLFDRFLHRECNRLDNVLVEAEADQYRSVGPTVFTKIGDLDLDRIDHWRCARSARQQLIEIASGYDTSYPLLDTTLWAVNDLINPENSLGVQYEDEFESIIAAREQMAPYSGVPLWFRGTKPTKKDINDLLGSTTWLSNNYITDLAQDLYDHYRILKDDKLFQEDAATFLGISKNTRTFPKIWSAFRNKLTPDEQDRLPKRGEKKQHRECTGGSRKQST